MSQIQFIPMTETEFNEITTIVILFNFRDTNVQHIKLQLEEELYQPQDILQILYYTLHYQ